MAELERKDVWSDELLNAPIQYAKNIQVAIDASKKLVDTLMGSEKNIQMATTLSGVSRETKKLSDAEAELAKVQKQITTASARQTSEYDAQNKKLLALRMQQQNKNKETKEEIVLTGRVGNEYKKLTIQLERARAKYKDMAASGRASTKELKAQERVVSSLNNKVTTIDKTVGQFNRNVGNYGSALAGSFKNILAAFGIIGGLKLGVDFLRDAKDIADEAKGIEFAFNRLGLAGEDAFEKVKRATRGLLSDLDIKKSLVSFDNFNISLEESATLFEFLSVRAAQTGASIEYLRDSLVEGLSKESKLRIDNLGISAAKLNSELEKTPNFVQAVANIAKEEIAEAGDILDEAASSQLKFNAAFENFQLMAGTGFVSTLANAFYDLGTAILNVINVANSDPIMESFNKQTKEAVENFKQLNKEAQAGSINRLVQDIGKAKQDLEEFKNEVMAGQTGMGPKEVLFELSLMEKGIVSLQDQYREFFKIYQGGDIKELSIGEQKAQLDLAKFRLEQEAKIQKEIIDSEKMAYEERIAATKELERIKSEIAGVERKNDLLDEENTKADLILIEEKYQAKKTDAAREGNKERDKLDDEQIKKAEEELKKRVELAKKESEELIKAKELELQKEIQAIQKFVLEGALSREEGDRAILQVRKKISLELIEFTIQQLEKELMIEGLTAEEKKKIYAEIAKFRLKLTDEMYAQLEEKREEDLTNTEEALQYLLENHEAFANQIIGIFNGITDRRIQAIDREIEALEKQTEREIELAGDNERAKEEIQARSESRREQLELKRRREAQAQARREKAAALFGAGINTARAISEALPNIPLAVAVGLLGALQIAAIASQPIPAFKDGGTTSTPLIIAGEEGHELYRTPSGKVGLTPDRASVMRMPIGTDIIPHDETMKMLAMGTINPNIQPDNELSHRLASLESVISKGNKSLIKAVIESAPGDLFSQGSLLMESKKRVDGSRKIIHKKTFG